MSVPFYKDHHDHHSYKKNDDKEPRKKNGNPPNFSGIGITISCQ